MKTIDPRTPRGGWFPFVCLYLFLWSFNPLLGQNPAPTGDHTFTTQTDLDAFFDAEGRYTSVSGNLTIDATGTITDLSNLALLEDIIGVFTIVNYGVDETIADPLAEMTSLNSVDRLMVGAGTGSLNPGITSLTSNSLTSIWNLIVVTRSEQLAIVDLPAVTHVGTRIVVSKLNALTSLRLPNDASPLFTLSLIDLPLLTDLQLSAIPSTTNLNLQDLDSLEGLSGLSGLDIQGALSSIRLLRNSSLLSVAALGSDIGGVSLEETSLEIRNNPLLTSIASFSGTTGRTFEMTDNAQLADLGTNLTFEGFLFYIEIGRNAALPTVAVLFSGADTLGVEALDIFDNPVLSDLGSRPIKLVSDMYLSNNPEITDLPNLTATTEMTGAFQGLYIEHNPKLTNLSALANLRSIGGDVIITDNGGLATLEGLDSLRTIGGSLVLARNDGLLNLDAVQALETIDNLLQVTDNGSLSQCCALQCSVLVQGEPVSQDNGFVTISGNQGDCATAATLDASFCPSNCSSASLALSVTLINFSAQATDRGNVLRWTTATEHHNDHFVVSSSATGYDFSEVGSVPGAGTRTTSTAYRYLDADADPGKTYYRLVAVDLDGSSTKSEVIVVGEDKSREAWSIYPNPAGLHSTPVIHWAESPAAEERKVVVINSVGRVVASLTSHGPSDVPITARPLPAGVYAVSVTTDRERRVIQLIVR